MKKYRAMLLLIIAYTMISCVGENSNNSTLIELHSPTSNRQIIPFNDIQWRAQIHVNNVPPQDFFFSNTTSPVPVNITGVRRGEENGIFIRWFEILHGHTVEMSEQSQGFFADGTTTINESHDYTQFDYDGDGTANLVERFDGTCVWSATEVCVGQGQTDIPTDNALLNGDFSELNADFSDGFRNGIRYWVSNPPVVDETSGEYCVTAPAMATDEFEARIDYSPRTVFFDENSTYDIVFDVRAQTDSEVLVLVTEKILDDFESLIDNALVPVSTTYETKSIRYESGQDAHNEVLIGFAFGNRTDTDNTYCFDNVKLIREL